MRSFKLLSVAIFALFLSCNKDKSNTSSSSFWIGNWGWVMTKGGIVGIQETPASTGRHLNYDFKDDTKLVITDNTNVVNTTYRVYSDTSQISGHIADILTVNNSSINGVLTHNGDTLVISEDMPDGYIYIFTRSK